MMRWVKRMYLKLFRINDTPEKIALGFGLGVFMGIMPFLGPVAALGLAFILRVNSTSAFLGGLLFNTWISLLTLFLAIKIGAAVMGIEYAKLQQSWDNVFKDFKWEKLWALPVHDFLIPIVLGYMIIALALTIPLTILVYVIIKKVKDKKLKRVSTGG